jgi:uncharacterized Zn finger protein
MSYYFARRPYISAAEKRRNAEREVAKLKKRGQSIAPVRIEGRTIAKSFWGQAWCANLESYSDYKNRLPRGRSYVRNGSVVDLQIGKGDVTAMVAGSDLYKIKVSIAPVAKARWKSICRDCAGSIDSLVELLQGRLAKGVMDRVCREGDGLFPSPGEINLACSCPDWAEMCKHVSAVLYAIGARLDEKPQLLFVLRGVDENELIAGAGQDLPLSRETPGAAKVLSDTDVAALFGLEMADTAGSDSININASKRQHPKVSKTASSDGPAASKQLKRSKPGNRSKPRAETTRPAGRKRRRQAAQRMTRVAEQARA